MFSSSKVLVLVVVLFAAHVAADTPGNCFWNQTANRDWDFYVSTSPINPLTDCTSFSNLAQQNGHKGMTKIRFTLSAPDVATANGIPGFWTMIYNQGFEVQHNGKSYFAFFNYTLDGSKVTSNCFKTFGGWTHDDPTAIGAQPKNWYCYYGIYASNSNTEREAAVNVHRTMTTQSRAASQSTTFEGFSQSYIDQVNKDASGMWTAGQSVFAGIKFEELYSRIGFHGMHHAKPPMPRESVHASAPSIGQMLIHKKRAKLGLRPYHTPLEALPDDFDWGKHMGPMRDQLSCGSCYAFGTTNMLNARARIMNPSFGDVFSPQDPVSCSMYSQGCDGGFPYLISKYGMDYGIVNDTSFPYMAGLTDAPIACSLERPNSSHRRVTGYHYVGGYWGACDAAQMQLALFHDGPLAVSMEVTDEFLTYRSGVFVPSSAKPSLAQMHGDRKVGDPNNFYVTNHVVVVTGWGIDKATSLPYWRVMNSWGAAFGEGGYFRIYRSVPGGKYNTPGGTLAIEEMAVGSFPVLN